MPFDELLPVSRAELETVWRALNHFNTMESYEEAAEVIAELRAAQQTLEDAGIRPALSQE